MLELFRQLCESLMQQYSKDLGQFPGQLWHKERTDMLIKMEKELSIIKQMVEMLYGETIEPTIFRKIMGIVKVADGNAVIFKC